MDRGPQGGPQLGEEHLRHGEAEAQGPVPQERIFLLGQLHTRELLIPADVQGPQGDRAIPKGGEDLFINLVLLLFGGELLPAHIDKLGAEKAHTAGVLFGSQLLAAGGTYI